MRRERRLPAVSRRVVATSFPVALLVALPPLSLLAAGLVPTRSANLHPNGMRGLVVALAGLALAAVLLVVTSRNLLMFTVSWLLTSAGLQPLLLHCSDCSASCSRSRAWPAEPS